MKAHWITIVGLMIDIIGVFFLSVEAIKLERLKKLRSSLSRYTDRISSGMLVVGALIALGAMRWSWESFLDPYGRPEPWTVVVAILVSGGAGLASLAATVLIVGIVLLFWEGILRFFDWVQTCTPDGTIGTLGFALVSFGFMLQAIATWLAAQQVPGQ